ncbi:MAG: integrase/recombinase [Haloplasmataceae bacterium]|jgi:integrase|nr:integrase/recombinase [Haloplasmataceae bacterium]
MARGTVYNHILTNENWAKVNQDNKDLLDEFVEYLQSTDKSPMTINGYIDDIKICWVWSLEHNKNKFFIDFTKRDVMKYQNHLLNTLNLSPNRIRRLKSAISSLANFVEAMMDDIYENYRNIINKIPAPTKVAVREKTVLTDEQAQTLLDELVKNKQYQKACVFALAWGSGSRKSELLRFKVSYFDDENVRFGSLYKTPEKIKTKGRGGKLGKQLFKFTLISKFKPYFDLWMDERKTLDIPDELKDTLFITKRKGEWQPMKITTLDSWADKFSAMLNVDFYFHCMRHNFCTGLSQAQVPATVIKEIVGWESVNMVEIYDDTEVDDKLGKYFDTNGIKKVEATSLEDLGESQSSNGFNR